MKKAQEEGKGAAEASTTCEEVSIISELLISWGRLNSNAVAVAENGSGTIGGGGLDLGC
jgi:hypothetical protein